MQVEASVSKVFPSKPNFGRTQPSTQLLVRLVQFVARLRLLNLQDLIPTRLISGFRRHKSVWHHHCPPVHPIFRSAAEIGKLKLALASLPSFLSNLTSWALPNPESHFGVSIATTISFWARLSAFLKFPKAACKCMKEEADQKACKEENCCGKGG